MVVINGAENVQEQTNITPQNLSESNFYYSDEFQFDINQLMSYYLDIEIEKYFSNQLKLPLNRIIYASNDYAFRERTRKNGGELNIPFMNYHITGYSDSERHWFNNFANLIYPLRSEDSVNILGTTFRVAPIKIEYEATIYFSQLKDAKYAFKNLWFEKSNETIIKYALPIGQEDRILNNGIVYFDLEFDPTFSESDWLEQNKIHTIACDFSIDTNIILSNGVNVPFIATKAFLDFLACKDLKTLDGDSVIKETIAYFEEEKGENNG